MLNNIPAPCNERMSGIDSKIVGIFYNLTYRLILKVTLHVDHKVRFPVSLKYFIGMGRH